jgi:hypothetical protein
VHSIISDRWRIPLPVDAVRVGTSARNGRRLGRLAAMEEARLAEALAFLIGYAPGIFDAIVTATEPCADDEPDPTREPEPFCRTCGGTAGIFWLLGEEWQHFRPGTRAEEKPEIYDPGHVPVIGWRNAGNEVSGLAIVSVPVI